jgi:hypothetical protein
VAFWKVGGLFDGCEAWCDAVVYPKEDSEYDRLVSNPDRKLAWDCGTHVNCSDACTVKGGRADQVGVMVGASRRQTWEGLRQENPTCPEGLPRSLLRSVIQYFLVIRMLHQQRLVSSRGIPAEQGLV